jgi:hypothetical protein
MAGFPDNWMNAIGNAVAGTIAPTMHTPFVSRKHADIEKPVCDVAMPWAAMKESDWAKHHGTGFGFFWHNSLSHFIGVPETVPYETSLSSLDCAMRGHFMLNLVWLQLFINKAQSSCSNPTNPRTKWAHQVVLYGGFVRVNLAALVGMYGYFYAYETLYTHVPGFRIRDPSPEGWKRAWEDGQTTYRARIAASVFPIMGHVIYRGTAKRVSAWWATTMYWQYYYEQSRQNGAFNGSMLFFAFTSSQLSEKHAYAGSLAPEKNRATDPDTGRPFWVASYDMLRGNHSRNYERMMDNRSAEYQPAHAANLNTIGGINTKNPWFNWQKSAQTYYEKKNFHTDYWKMPNVLHAHMLSGACDAVQQR